MVSDYEDELRKTNDLQSLSLCYAFFYEYPPLALPSAKVSFIVGRLDDVGATSIDVGSVVCRTSMCSALFVLLGLKRLSAPLAPAQCVGASQAGLPVCLSVCMELM